MYKVRGPPSSAVSILKFLPHSSAPGSVLLLFWPEGLGFSWGVSYFCCRSVSLNKGHPLHKEVTENKRENDRFWLHSLDHKGPFRCSSGNTTKIWGRYFSCLSCCLLFYHVVLWWVATLGKEKRKKKKKHPNNPDFPSHSSIYMGLLFKASDWKEEDSLRDFLLPHHAAWMTTPTRDRSHTLCIGDRVLITGPPGKPSLGVFVACIWCVVPTASHLWREKRNKPGNVLTNGFLSPVFIVLPNTPAVYPSWSGVASCIWTQFRQAVVSIVPLNRLWEPLLLSYSLFPLFSPSLTILSFLLLPLSLFPLYSKLPGPKSKKELCVFWWSTALFKNWSCHK